MRTAMATTSSGKPPGVCIMSGMPPATVWLRMPEQALGRQQIRQTVIDDWIAATPLGTPAWPWMACEYLSIMVDHLGRAAARSVMRRVLDVQASVLAGEYKLRPPGAAVTVISVWSVLGIFIARWIVKVLGRT